MQKGEIRYPVFVEENWMHPKLKDDDPVEGME